ncbi:MAG: SPOR domain-containing protein [Phycisphaeraceae bacterium]|nr:SPOR domain-containing protein [Phycisphaeraceae bacterium]
MTYLPAMTQAYRGQIVPILAGLLLLAGCAAKQPATPKLSQAYDAYNQGNFASAYQLAHTLADRQPSREAAYMAGLSAYRLGSFGPAKRYLTIASTSADRKLAGDSLATLGMIYTSENRFAEAANAYEKAGAALAGQERANAYFYAGLSLQKLGRWSQARSDFTLARSASTDREFLQRVVEQMATTGFTLQTGYFSVQDNARHAAEDLAPLAAQQRLGLPRIVIATDASGKPGWMVQVGQFSSYTSANEARRRLNHPTAIIVPLTK